MTRRQAWSWVVWSRVALCVYAVGWSIGSGEAVVIAGSAVLTVLFVVDTLRMWRVERRLREREDGAA